MAVIAAFGRARAQAAACAAAATDINIASNAARSR